MKQLRTTLLTLLLCAAGPIAAANDCGPAPEGFGPATQAPPPGLENIAPGTLFQAPLGWIVAPTSAEAICMAVEMEAGAVAFVEHFGIAPPPGVVMDVIHAARIKALLEGGVAWVMPWRFQSESSPGKPTPRETAIRAQIEQQLAAIGKEPGTQEVDRLVKQALGSLDQKDSDNTKALEPTAVRHELAHKWFGLFVWRSESPKGGYASGAPDWLDEIAAVSAESPQMTQSRRRQFAEAQAAGRWIPLREFTEMLHPVFAAPAMSETIARAQAEAQAAGASVTAMSMPSASPELADRAVLFYTQARSLLDYLKHRSQSPRILRLIAEALQGGDSFPQWLATAGAGLGLPSDIDALEGDWLAWAHDQPPAKQPASHD